MLTDIEMQGSVLGPIKAAVHMDKIGQSLSKDLKSKKTYKYKGEVVVPPIKMIDDVDSVENCRVNSLIENAHINCQIEMKKLPLNTKKCKQLHMGHKNNLCPMLKVHGESIERVENEKYLGVIIHTSLKPSMHCARAASRANQVLGQPGRAVTYRDKKTFLKLYSVYVRPHLEYAVQSWCPYTLEDKAVLEKIQKRAISMVSNFKSKTKSYEDKLGEAGMNPRGQETTRRHAGDVQDHDREGEC